MRSAEDSCAEHPGAVTSEKEQKSKLGESKANRGSRLEVERESNKDRFGDRAGRCGHSRQSDTGARQAGGLSERLENGEKSLEKAVLFFFLSFLELDVHSVRVEQHKRLLWTGKRALYDVVARGAFLRFETVSTSSSLFRPQSHLSSFIVPFFSRLICLRDAKEVSIIQERKG